MRPLYTYVVAKQAFDLDLHKFIHDPGKARGMIDACISDCVQKNISLIRVIHGKGKGDFRKLVYSHLERHPDVEGYVLCDPTHGGSGATWVHLAVGSEENSPLIEQAAENSEDIDKGIKPLSPWMRRILLLILLVSSFIVFPEWIARAGMITLVFFLELGMNTGDKN